MKKIEKMTAEKYRTASGPVSSLREPYERKVKLMLDNESDILAATNWRELRQVLGFAHAEPQRGVEWYRAGEPQAPIFRLWLHYGVPGHTIILSGRLMAEPRNRAHNVGIIDERGCDWPRFGDEYPRMQRILAHIVSLFDWEF